MRREEGGEREADSAKEERARRRTHVVVHGEEHRRREDDALSVDAGIDEARCARLSGNTAPLVRPLVLARAPLLRLAADPPAAQRGEHARRDQEQRAGVVDDDRVHPEEILARVVRQALDLGELQVEAQQAHQPQHRRRHDEAELGEQRDEEPSLQILAIHKFIQPVFQFPGIINLN
mgnify:CR=1 FL=1